MDAKEQFLSLLQAQDAIRLVWAHQPTGILNTALKEIDREVTKVIVQLGKMIRESN